MNGRPSIWGLEKSAAYSTSKSSIVQGRILPQGFLIGGNAGMGRRSPLIQDLPSRAGNLILGRLSVVATNVIRTRSRLLSHLQRSDKAQHNIVVVIEGSFLWTFLRVRELGGHYRANLKATHHLYTLTLLHFLSDDRSEYKNP